MSRTRQIGMAAGTFSVVLSIGFIMQNGDALASRFDSEDVTAKSAPVLPDTEEASVNWPVSSPDLLTEDEVAIPVAQAGIIMAAAPHIDMPSSAEISAVRFPEATRAPFEQEAQMQLAALDPEDAPFVDRETTAIATIDCVPSMVAQAGPAASVNLFLNAPCHTSAPFTVHHQGLMFTAVTDDAGEARLIVPALAEVAVLIAAFEDGDGAVATAVLPDFASYDRAVLQWQGNTAVMLSAYEGDAGFGDDTHIHVDNPGDMNRLEAAQGGYLMRLGDMVTDNALMAEVYTFPSGTMQAGIDVMLAAEVQITDNNCGQELSAQSIQVSPNGETSALDLTMIMPECDAVGDFLILQNMFEDLTLALR